MAARWQQNYQLYRRYVRNLAIMYQKRQDIKMFVEILLSLTVIVIFGMFAIRPTLVTVIGLNNEINGKRDTIIKLDDKIAALSDAQRVYDTNIDVITIINEAIPKTPYPVEYARQIEGLAQKHGLSIIGMSTEDVPLIQGFQTIEEVPQPVDVTEEVDSFPPNTSSFEFAINMSGDYAGISGFLKDLENHRHPLYQDNLSIQISAGASLGQIILSATGRLPYLP